MRYTFLAQVFWVQVLDFRVEVIGTRSGCGGLGLAKQCQRCVTLSCLRCLGFRV